MIAIETLYDTAVRTALAAINAGDREAFLAAFAPGATLSDDGTQRDFTDWIDREIFSAGGHIEVESESPGGQSLIARYRNQTYGEMRTSWEFTVEDGLITHVATGQA